MGFLSKTVFAKRLNKSNLFALTILASVFSCALATMLGSAVYAAPEVTNYGLYTDSDDVRWEWEVVSDSENVDEPQRINIMFYDKPENLVTVTIPSYDTMTGITGVTPSTDTYYVKNANQESQDTRFTSPDPARRTANQADVTTLDMTNTFKVQIMGVKPIINPETEVELIFGDNMVIGDGLAVHLDTIWIDKCTGWSDYYIDDDYDDDIEGEHFNLCREISYEMLENGETLIPNWKEKTFEEQMHYTPTAEDFGYVQPQRTVSTWIGWGYEDRIIIPVDEFDSSLPYVTDVWGGRPYTELEVEDGPFSGYKLKLTNFENLNYVGWNAFADSVFNESNTTMTIDGDAFVGQDIFARTNIKKAIINTNSAGAGLFRDCANLTEVVFGENVTKVGYYDFMGTNLGSFDFSKTNIKTILRGAFDNAHLTEINLDGVEKLDYEAFANNDLRELVLPKSIKDLNSARIFAGNRNLTKLTVAYDTQTSGTLTPLHAAIGEWLNDDGCVAHNIKELTILAPYGENDAVSDTHLSYGDYVVDFAKKEAYDLDAGSVYLANEDAEADKYKNVIAKGYFAYVTGIEDLIIGEGYEYIGAQAFYNYPYGPYTENTNVYFEYNDNKMVDKKFHASLPETLKGIGGGAFAAHYDTDFAINLPQSLEFIGNRAFYNDYLMKVDVDLPNLRYIGSHAFYTAGIRNLYLHDGLEWVGTRPFQGCWNLHDVTFDYDVFGENSELFSSFTRDYQGNFSSSIFGHPITTYEICSGTCNGYYDSENEVGVTGWGRNAHRLGTITFTEKATTSPRVYQYNNEREDDTTDSVMHTWFYDLVAEKIDLSKTGWREISAGAFQFSAIDEVVLPENLEKIWGAAFYGARIKKELILPDSLEFIASDAFNNKKSLENDVYFDGQNYYDKDDNLLDREEFETRRTLSVDDHEPCTLYFDPEERYTGDGCYRDGRNGTYYYQKPFGYTHGVTITKIPSSVNYIGNGAFYGDDRASVSVDLPGLKRIGRAAFWSSDLHDLKLNNELEVLGSYAFSGNNNLGDVVVDCDIVTLATKDRNTYYNTYEADDYNSGNIFARLFNTDTRKTKDVTYNAEGYMIDEGGRPDVAIKMNSLKLTANVVFKMVPENVWNERYWESHQVSSHENRFDSQRYDGYYSPTSPFYNAVIGEIDLSETGWDTIPERMFFGAQANTIKLPANLTSVPDYAFYGATVSEPVEIPSGVTTIGTESFQNATIAFSNALPEGVTTVGPSAFYGADIHGDMTIPSTITSIGEYAFNAGDTDTHYGTVTIKSALDYVKTSNQAVFQIFWNATMDKLVIESPMLPVLGTLQAEPVLPDPSVQTLRADGEPEFHAMTMKEVEIKNLPVITANAFEDCANLETVSFAGHDSLSEIGKFAFNNDTKLKKFVFGDGLVGKDVALKEYAFNKTAIETIGNHNSDFDLTAANFSTVDEHVFSNMPGLKSVDVPNNFNIDASLANAEKNVNGAHITAFTFADDPELENVSIAYQIAEIRDGAFLNDEKLTKLFVWGNTEIQESDDLIRDFNNTTIPQSANIFAYSDAPSEQYANDDSRSAYTGKFYPLDEVLYLTSNKIYVVLEQDEEGNNVDFDKDGLVLYALRRDGVILESDDWQTYTKAFPRTTAPNIKFEEGKGAAGNLGTDEELIWTVYDAPKPFDTISLANQNYGATSFEFIQMPSSANPLVAIHYPDAYTAAIRTTTIASTTKEEEEAAKAAVQEELEVPNTGALQTIASIAVPSVSIAAIIVLGGIYIARKRKN